MHGDLLKSFHLLITHGVICAIVVEDHGVLVCAFIGLVASAAASETLEGACLDGLIGRSRRRRARLEVACSRKKTT